ncbi:hypothetical protein [Aequorivita echinoideorum]|uniref:Uncharacterized protein n=1 Tax=Aequorivita echinoideorum TaxID=1549647 RepID=A0ABS5S4Y2_9FLAO|nr:hypothetical protein [Aequorivita echinoideorum]MBT0608282.1 hypothetical protein [Aequorivita echinoideorum]
MAETEDGFGKKRDQNQYGEVEKDPKKEKREQPVPKSDKQNPDKKKKK